MSHPLCRLAGLALTSAFFAGAASAQVHAPIKPIAATIVDVVTSSAEDAEHVDITVVGGQIVSIEPTGAELAPGTQVFEGMGRLVQPGLIDAWTTSGVDSAPAVAQQDRPIDVKSDIRAAMRSANRKGIKPSFLAADVVDFEADGAGAWRAAGFGVLLAAPSGELLAGHGALCVTRAGARRELVLNPEVFQFGQFSARGGGFPSTTMGYFSQLRQFFYDSQRQQLLQARYFGGSADPRPAWDPELDAGAKLLDGRELYVVRADRAGDVERWMRLADEFGLRIAIAGGREAWRHAGVLAERGIPVLLDMNFGDEVDDPNEEEGEQSEEPSEDADEEDTDEAGDEDTGDEADEDEEAEVSWHYTEPLELQVERRRLWEQKRDNAKVLTEAGVRVFFVTGNRKPKQLVADLNTAIDAGLDADKVRAAMTSEAALFLGLDRRMGQVAVGYDANFALWTADPFDADEEADDADIAMMVVDGIIQEFDVAEPGSGPDEGVDASGTWTLLIDSEDAPESSTIALEMDEEGRVTGTYNSTNPADGSPLATSMSGKVSGEDMSLKGILTFGEMELKFHLELKLNGDAFSGTSTWSGPWGEESSSVTGTREPDRSHVHSFDDETETHYSCKH